METTPHKPLRIFCSYSHRDEEYLNDLRDWLRGLERQGFIEWWHDREISPGWEWEEAIDKNLRTAEVIILLVTSAFMASDYAYERGIGRAVERHERGEARVIPIIVRPTDWEGEPFGKLQALPKNAKPITDWSSRDKAWLDVSKGIRKTVEDFSGLTQQTKDQEQLVHQYREAVKSAWAHEAPNSRRAQQLRYVANTRLGLAPSVAADIEREVMGDTLEAILERQEQAVREEERRNQLEELYAQGDAHLQAGRYEEALADLNRAIELDPGDDWYLYNRAIVCRVLDRKHLARTNLKAAIRLAQQSYAENPQLWRNTFNLALYHLAAGEPEKAKLLYRETLSKEASEVSISDAADDLNDFLALFPDHAHAKEMLVLLRKAIAP